MEVDQFGWYKTGKVFGDLVSGSTSEKNIGAKVHSKIYAWTKNRVRKVTERSEIRFRIVFVLKIVTYAGRLFLGARNPKLDTIWTKFDNGVSFRTWLWAIFATTNIFRLRLNKFSAILRIIDHTKC